MYTQTKGKRPEGRSYWSCRKTKTDFVGVIDIQKNFAFVSTANPKMYTDILFQRIN
jgi:ribonuclease R